jgi:hypothetical protein
MNSITNLTPQQLRHAADIQERILGLQEELNGIMGTAPSFTVSVAAPTGKRRLSAKGLANIRAGARKRWANLRGGNGAAEKPTKRKGRMSAAGRAAIAARMKKRWAAAKRAGRNAL